MSVRGDAPVGQTATEYGQLLSIMTHPALRLGFLDALAEQQRFDHDDIMRRVERETAEPALKELRWDRASPGRRDLLADIAARERAVELAQYRYEEGRMLVIEYGVRCKAWSDPRYLPAAVARWCRDTAAKRRQRSRGCQP